MFFSNRFFSLRYKMLVSSLFIIIFSLFILSMFTYVQFTDYIENKVSQADLNTVKKIGYSIQDILDHTVNLSLYLIQNKELIYYLKLPADLDEKQNNLERIYIERFLGNFIDYNSMADYIYIEGFNGKKAITNSKGDSITEAEKMAAISLNGLYNWTFEQKKIGQSDINTINFTRLIKNRKNLPESLGIMKIYIDEKTISDTYTDISIDSNSDFIIIDNNNTIVSTRDKSRIGEKNKTDPILNINSNVKKGFFKTKIGKQKYIISFYQIDQVGWTLLKQQPLSELMFDTDIVKQVIIIGLIISFMLSAFFATFFSGAILKPLSKLTGSMEIIEKDNFTTNIHINSNDEIGMLGKSFNKMVSRIKSLIDIVYVAKIKQKEAEIRNLESQINPHFLYNTLDIIRWKSRMESAMDTATLVEALSNLLRMSLNTKDQIVTVSAEISHIKNYIHIQSYRYQGKIKFELNADKNTYDLKTVKLVLQPLVENAIYHGIESNGGYGNIKITIYRKEKRLIFKVEDDGKGIDLNEINKLLIEVNGERRGMAVKNVNDRIKLCFGDEYGLEFSRSKNNGLCVRVYQPC